MEPSQGLSPQEFARLERAEAGKIVVVVLRRAEVRGVAGIDGVEERHVVRLARRHGEIAVHDVHPLLARPLRGEERALRAVGGVRLREKPLIPLEIPGAAAERVAVRRVVAGLAPHRADLVEEEGRRAQLVQDPTGEVVEHLVPERGVGAHRRLVARELSVALVDGLPVGAGNGVRTRQREAQQVRAPHPSLRVRHRLLPQRTDVLQAIPRAGSSTSPAVHDDAAIKAANSAAKLVLIFIFSSV